MSYAGLDLKGRVAVVIGGTSGIGRMISLGLAEAGADVVPSARRADLVDATAGEIEALGRRSLRLCSDVTEPTSIQNLLNTTVTSLGKVDVMVYAAGRTKRTPLLELDAKEWNAILETNLTGALHAGQVFGRYMIEQKYGRIVTIASLASFVALHEVAAYNASKAALASLTKSMAVEWARHGVCVNAIAPGVFRTELNQKLLDGTARGAEFLLRTPMKRFGQLKELVGPAIFLASESASYVTGAVLTVDGGFLASGVNQ